MKKITFYFIIAIFATTGSFAAEVPVCSRANLIQCLDSACAINIGANPAARCQLCGTSNAGGENADTLMKQLSVGFAAKNTLSSAELKSAPTDAGARYIWAADVCTKKIVGCAGADITESYDKLIEQSCKSAGIDVQMSQLQAGIKKTKTLLNCQPMINSCTITKCGADFGNCKSDSDFDKFFGVCATESVGCDGFAADIKKSLNLSRVVFFATTESNTESIIAGYKLSREKQTANAQNDCENNSARASCIKTVCENNMKNKCADGNASEKSMANQMCVFYDIACTRLK